MLKSIAILMAFFSCTTLIRSSSQQYQIEYAQIDSFVNNFYSDAKLLGYNVSKKFIPIYYSKYKKNSTTIATCYIGIINTITINRPVWLTLGPLRRQMVIYHELGHCVLNRDHTDEIIPNKDLKHFDDGCNYSIMTKYIETYYCLERHYAYYIKELFKNGQVE